MNFSEILKDAVDRVDGAVSAMILGSDGIPVEEYSSQKLLNLDDLGAEASAMIMSINTAARDLGLGAAREFSIISDTCGIILRQINDSYYLFQRCGLAPEQAQQLEQSLPSHELRVSLDLEDRILALDPTNVTAQDVRDVLSRAPAPRVANIHGGLARVIPRMASFSEFLIGMGYPASSLTNPSDGTYSFSCYESSEKIAGVIAWFYEREGPASMMVGHSQGGMQVVKVLYRFAGKPSARLHVWNPLTWEKEKCCDILDVCTRQRITQVPHA